VVDLPVQLLVSDNVMWELAFGKMALSTGMEAVMMLL